MKTGLGTLIVKFPSNLTIVLISLKKRRTGSITQRLPLIVTYYYPTVHKFTNYSLTLYGYSFLSLGCDGNNDATRGSVVKIKFSGRKGFYFELGNYPQFKQSLIKGGEVGFDGYKLARKRLENLIKSTGKHSFSSLKQAVELYLLVLPLTVQGRSLRSYFKGFKRSMIDEIIEFYNPTSPVSSTRIYELDEDVDDNLRDDLISIWKEDIEFLSTVRTPRRFNKILRRIGAKHFLPSETRNRVAFQNLLQLRWKEESSITDFIKTFEKLLQKCNEVELFQNTKDQMILFQMKIVQQRSKNNAVFNLVNHLDRSEPELLMDYMTEFQQ
eukprot:snap_masked-scaffold_82-processed-gene-0.25-mRNA-1 protein AED:1.00 eAED:1.00 QI:0/0/0/0/1/1/3/0/325